MTEHSNIGVGGSTAGRVMACPPSRLVASEPQKDTDFTRMGTLLHNAMEMVLTGNTVEETLVLLDDAAQSDDERETLRWKFFRALEIWRMIQSDTTVKQIHIEKRLHLGPVPGAFGTVDVLIEHHDNAVTVLDWKFGDGVMVSANSPQLHFYAAAAMTDPETKHLFNGNTSVRLIIVQPSDRDPDNVLRTARTTTTDLVFFMSRLKWAVDNGHDDSLLNAGDHCKFCPVKPVCPKLKQLATQALQYDDPHNLTPEEIGEALAMTDKLEAWIKSIRDYAHERLEHGREVTGYKLVPRRAQRKWLNETEVNAWLHDNTSAYSECFTEPKLKSVAQVEKLVKDLPKELYEKKSSGTTIARADDPRPEATSTKMIEHAAARLRAYTL